MGRSRRTIRRSKEKEPGFYLSRHYMIRFRQRVKGEVDDNEILAETLRRLSRSKLIALEEGMEYRAYRGDIYVINTKNHKVVTVYWSKTKHKVYELASELFSV